MRRLQVHSHGRGRPCPLAVARVLASVDAGERLCVVTDSRDDAEAVAYALRDCGVLGVHLAGALIEIHPDRMH